MDSNRQQTDRKFLPLFPLQLVVFPGEKLKLHIFEPRYKQLIGECQQFGNTFGLPAYTNGRLAEFGTEMRLLQVFTVFPDGEMDILVEGVSAFRLLEFLREVPEKLYWGGQVDILENDTQSFPVATEELARQFVKFHELLKTGYERDNFNIRNLSFQIAQEVGLSLEQKVKLLSIPKESDRQLMIISHLHGVIPTLAGVEDTKRKIRSNGHFHKLPPLTL